MKLTLIKQENSYLLILSYEVPSSLENSWSLLATNQGFARWFPQLRIEGEKLVFEMEDFREYMDLLAYRPHEMIASTWDTAKISFTLSQEGQGTQIVFEEEIPVNFGNEFANVQKDVTGWLVQNDCIKALLNDKELPDRSVLREKWEAMLVSELEGL
ncbi:TPA: ATPase [Streptococcus suis]|nr:ATPase [Streptococcus suis]